MIRAGVAAANALAAQAGAAMLAAGGSAIDAAVAAGAAMAVTSPHMCGLGGDLLALVCEPGTSAPLALNASGRAGSGADPDGLRAEGHDRMPFRGDVRSVTVPGCVDGLLALHARGGRLTLREVLAPATALARDGFPVSATLAVAARGLEPALRAAAFTTGTGRDRGAPLRAGETLRLPGLADVLGALAVAGRAAFYEGGPGDALRALGGGLFTADDLRRPLVDWTVALSATAFGRALWTVPPNSQGYLALAGAWIADAAGIPEDPVDPTWVCALVEAARAAARDRLAVLHEHADGAALLTGARLAPRAAAIGAGARAAPAGEDESYAAGDTTYLCAVDAAGGAVSLILSNCAGFGAHLLLPGSAIFLHNRGIGFSLTPGHPAEFGPGRRPPHTLSPLAVTGPGHALRAVLGTMGGDAQPQIGLQLLARTLHGGQDPAEAIVAPRFVLAREPSTGFDTWEHREPPIVVLEAGAPPSWAPALRARGHVVSESAPGATGFGHAQMIVRDGAGGLRGAADPRALDGAFVSGAGAR